MRKESFKCIADFTIEDFHIGNAGDILIVSDVIPSHGEDPEDLAGYCDIHNTCNASVGIVESVWLEVEGNPALLPLHTAEE